ncbi:MAG: hypothetical protein MRY83_19130 [Flavobacteriales bacterium]|nr:hypothetical protein [Flavobacteriales bacterium]
MHKRFLLFNLIVLLSVPLAKSQDEGDKALAKEHFEYGNWKLALEENEALLKEDKKSPVYNYRIGICHLQLRDYKEAIRYLDASIVHGTYEKRAPFMLAKAYHMDYQFDKAIEKYTAAIQTTGDDDLVNRAKRYIEMCEDAPNIMADSLKNISIKNAGDAINSEAPDYLPYIAPDESYLYFNTKRSKGNNGYDPGNGFYTADPFIALEKRGEWDKVKSLGAPVVTTDVDELTGVSPNGKILLINRINNEIRDDIFLSKKVGKRFSEPQIMMLPVNTPNKEFSGTITNDGNTIYFCSDRGEGEGGMDIYRSKRLPTGDWALAEPIEALNSEWDELHPHLSYDGSKMYFASEGHTGMGGFDIFVSEWDSITSNWGKPKNIGYPINDVDDDFIISFTKEGRYAYTSKYMKDSKGDLDIYRITFEDVEPRTAAFVGNIHYKAPVDYTNFQEFLIYEKDGKPQRFTKDYTPNPEEWKFVSKEKKEVKPGYKYVLYATFDYNGQDKTFTAEKIPQGDPRYKFKSVSIKLMPIKNYRPISKNAPKEIDMRIKTAFIRVHDEEGNIFGEYVPSPNSGRYVVILPEDRKFKMTLMSDGFEDYVQDIEVIGKGSFKKISKKDILLKPTREPEKVHYTEVYDRIKDKL